MFDPLNLRPLTVSEILDKALRLYRGHFAGLLGIVAVAMIPAGILEISLAYLWGSGQNIGNLIGSLFSSCANLALIVAVSSIYLGHLFSLSSAYASGLKRIWSVWGAGLLVGLALVIPTFALIFGVALAVPMLGVAGLIVIVPFIFFLSTRWSLAAPAIVLEKLGAADGLRRSWELTRDHFWRVAGTSLAASLLTVMLTILPNLFTTFLLGALGASPQVLSLTGLVVEQIALICAMPFTTAVPVLIYYDLRIRKEGFDLQLRAERGVVPQPLV